MLIRQNMICSMYKIRYCAKSGQAGFSLLELMITLVIIGILMALTVPSMATMIIQARIQAKADMFVAAITQTRAEAFKRNTTATIAYTKTDGTHGDGGYTITCASCTTITSISEGGSQKFNVLTASGGTVAAKTSFDSFGNLADANPDGTANATVLEGIPTGVGLLGTCKPATATSPSPCQVNVVISSAGAVRTCRPALASGTSPFAC